ncbi:exosortase R [Leifsonia aquatica]|uniref:exosortase R n=1 Tax=Leifsonia aquatica TaxID=144185 RepID=UPI00046A15F5|nr:exosortase R [Leifsonia aquatica]
MTTAAPTRRDIARGAAQDKHDKQGRYIRILIALLLAGLGGSLIAIERASRGIEVIVSTWLLPLLFAGDAVPARTRGNPSVAFETGGHWYALIITPECSIGFYVAAIVFLGAALTLVQRFRLSRIFLAVGISALGLVLLNQVRIAGLAFLLSHYGHDAFDWAHSIGGSFLMMAGLTGCLALLFVLVVRGSRKAVR